MNIFWDEDVLFFFMYGFLYISWDNLVIFIYKILYVD